MRKGSDTAELWVGAAEVVWQRVVLGPDHRSFRRLPFRWVRELYVGYMSATFDIAMSKALALRSVVGEDVTGIIEFHLRMDKLKERARTQHSLALVLLQECIQDTPRCVNHPVDRSSFAWSWRAICCKDV